MPNGLQQPARLERSSIAGSAGTTKSARNKSSACASPAHHIFVESRQLYSRDETSDPEPVSLRIRTLSYPLKLCAAKI